MFLFPFSSPCFSFLFFLSFCFPLFFFFLSLSLSVSFFVLSPSEEGKSLLRAHEFQNPSLAHQILTSAQKLDVDAYCPGKRACQVSALKEGGLDQAHPAEQRFACILFIKSQLFSCATDCVFSLLEQFLLNILDYWYNCVDIENSFKDNFQKNQNNSVDTFSGCFVWPEILEEICFGHAPLSSVQVWIKCRFNPSPLHMIFCCFLGFFFFFFAVIPIGFLNSYRKEVVMLDTLYLN